MGKAGEAARSGFRAAGRFLATPAGALLLFALTFLTTTAAGAALEGTDPFLDRGSFLEGLPFSVPLLFILLSHETGHWLAARRHGVPTTPPLFLPVYFGTGVFSPGTFGAFIRIRSSIPDRNALMDIGVSGPFAGAVAALPILAAGLSLSRVVPLDGLGGLRLGEPLLFRLLSRLVIGPVPAGSDVLLHPVALAGWFGLLVTMLNLVPAGQLDGGHAAYALFGPAWRTVSRYVPWLALALAVAYLGWVVFAALLFFLIRTTHPPTDDDSVPLTRGRRLMGYGAAALLVLCFIPAPVSV